MTAKEPPTLMSIAVEPKSPDDRPAVEAALRSISEGDPQLSLHIDNESNYLTLDGMSELQLDIAIDRLTRDYGLLVNLGAPQVAYRERLVKKCDIDYTHKKLLAGQGQFARVRILFEPNERDAGSRFDIALGGADLAADYLAGVRKGFESALTHGLLAGFPVVDVKATLLDGASLERHSSALTFEIAARAATREALQKGGCVLMEPIMRLEITAPVEYQGSINGDIWSRRGEIVQRADDGKTLTLVAMAPLGNLFGYQNQLRSFTLGRGDHRMNFSHYAEMPEKAPRNPDGTFPPAIGMRMSA